MPFSTCERIVEMNPTPRIPSFPRMGIQQLQSLALDPRCRGGDDFADVGILHKLSRERRTIYCDPVIHFG